MPLDPQIAQLLEQIAAADGPPMTAQTPQAARESYAAMAALDGRPAQPADTEDRMIDGPGGAIPVRIYRPAAGGPIPTLVYFHGGGFVIGGIATHDGLCQQLATAVPAVVVSVDYRLAPEHPFPAAVQDAEAATTWVREHGAELGGDPARIAVGGDSAGGNLAAVTARRLRDAGGPPIAFQLLFYPVTDFAGPHPSHDENAEGYLLTIDMMAWFKEHYLGGSDPADPDASPLLARDLGGLPPALVVTAEYDPLRDEGEAYAAKLVEAGVEARVSRHAGMIHGFVSLGGLVGQAGEGVDEAVAALRSMVPR
jgi:acetyl esterase